MAIMDIACVARLDTVHGPLFLFDSSAVQVVLETIPIVSEIAGGVSIQRPLGETLITNSAADSAIRFEGFTIDEWAVYAKKKSSLASRICKQNVELKAKLASGDICAGQFDSFNTVDPWAGAAFHCENKDPDDCADVWSQWIPSTIHQWPQRSRERTDRACEGAAIAIARASI